jgi:hypothetical protein
MAKAPKKTVKTLSDKLAKINDSFTINLYDNGFMVEAGGRDDNDEWITAKLMVATIEDLLTVIREAADMERS